MSVVLKINEYMIKSGDVYRRWVNTTFKLWHDINTIFIKYGTIDREYFLFVQRFPLKTIVECIISGVVV